MSLPYYRIYRDLSRSDTIQVAPEEVADLIFYNRFYRPGCAQVLDGKVVYRGYLSAAELVSVDSTVTDDIPGVTVAQAIEVMKSAGVVVSAAGERNRRPVEYGVISS